MCTLRTKSSRIFHEWNTSRSRLRSGTQALSVVPSDADTADCYLGTLGVISGATVTRIVGEKNETKQEGIWHKKQETVSQWEPLDRSGDTNSWSILKKKKKPSRLEKVKRYPKVLDKKSQRHPKVMELLTITEKNLHLNGELYRLKWRESLPFNPIYSTSGS